LLEPGHEVAHQELAEVCDQGLVVVHNQQQAFKALHSGLGWAQKVLPLVASEQGGEVGHERFGERIQGVGTNRVAQCHFAQAELVQDAWHLVEQRRERLQRSLDLGEALFDSVEVQVQLAAGRQRIDPLPTSDRRVQDPHQLADGQFRKCVLKSGLRTCSQLTVDRSDLFGVRESLSQRLSQGGRRLAAGDQRLNQLEGVTLRAGLAADLHRHALERYAVDVLEDMLEERCLANAARPLDALDHQFRSGCGAGGQFLDELPDGIFASDVAANGFSLCWPLAADASRSSCIAGVH